MVALRREKEEDRGENSTDRTSSPSRRTKPTKGRGAGKNPAINPKGGDKNGTIPALAFGSTSLTPTPSVQHTKGLCF